VVTDAAKKREIWALLLEGRRQDPRNREPGSQTCEDPGFRKFGKERRWDELGLFLLVDGRPCKAWHRFNIGSRLLLLLLGPKNGQTFRNLAWEAKFESVAKMNEGMHEAR
jgi:hypothetical protein